MLIKGTKKQGGFKILCGLREEWIVFLDLLQAVENTECNFEMWCGGQQNSKSQAKLRSKFYNSII